MASKAARKHLKSSAWKEFVIILHQPVLLLTIIAILAILAIFVLYPILRIINLGFTNEEGAASLEYLTYILGSRSYRTVFLNSIRLAAIVALLSTVVGYIFAYGVTRIQMRGRKFFNTLIHLPIISPPFILALSIIFLFGR